MWKEDARQKDCSLRGVPSAIPQPVETCDAPPPQDRLEPEATRRAGRRKGAWGLYRVRKTKGVETVRIAGLWRRPGEKERRVYRYPGSRVHGCCRARKGLGSGAQTERPFTCPLLKGQENSVASGYYTENR